MRCRSTGYGQRDKEPNDGGGVKDGLDRAAARIAAKVRLRSAHARWPVRRVPKAKGACPALAVADIRPSPRPRPGRGGGRPGGCDGRLPLAEVRPRSVPD